MLTGAQAPIDHLSLPAKQAPDAAPRWARTDQTIPLWDYATAGQLQGDGTAPLNVYFRIPPDLYYETGSENTQPASRLSLQLHSHRAHLQPAGAHQQRIPRLHSAQLPARTHRAPPRPMFPFPWSTCVRFQTRFRLITPSSLPTNKIATTPRRSIFRARSFATPISTCAAIRTGRRCPILKSFSNAGFPFTRLADLSGTTVVLPLAPTEQEIETFVTLMGHFGRQTGFPGLRVTVAGPDALHDGAATDFLIIGVGDDQPAFDKLGTHLPVSLGSGQVQVHDTAGFFVYASSQRMVEAALRPAHRIRRAHRRWHARRRHRGHRISVRHRRQPQHRRHSSQGRVHLRAVHEHVSQRPAVKRRLRLRLRAPRNRVSILPRRLQVYYVGVLPWFTQLRLWAQNIRG